MYNFEDITTDQAFLSVVATLMLIIYTTIIVSLYKDTSSDKDLDRVINTVNATIRGEIQTLKKVCENKNPYDLFTTIYPTLKEMSNERIEELIDILTNYNSNWIYEVET